MHRRTYTRAVRVLFTGTPVPFEFTPLLGSLIGVVAALLLITVAILAALKMRSERRAQRPGDLPLKKATAPSSEDLYDADDRNPDVVPTNKGTFPETVFVRGREWLIKKKKSGRQMLCISEKLHDIEQTYHACQFYYRIV